MEESDFSDDSPRSSTASNSFDVDAATPKGRNAEQCLEIATTNKQKSPFLRLPPELRNRIYRLALSGKKLQFFRSSPELCYRHFVDDRRAPHNFLALLSVSRQIYAEAHAFPLTLNTFQFLNSSISRLGPHHRPFSEYQRSLIKSVTLAIIDESACKEGLHADVEHKRLFLIRRRIPNTVWNIRVIFPTLSKLLIMIHFVVPYGRTFDSSLLASKICWESEVRSIIEEQYGNPPFETHYGICNCRESFGERDRQLLASYLDIDEK